MGGASEEIPDHDYGVTTPFLSGSGFLSNTDLLLWLEQHSGELGDHVRAQMADAELRNKVVEDLTFLRSHVAKGADLENLQKEAEELMAAYADTPLAEQVEKATYAIINDTNEELDAADANAIKKAMQSVTDKLGEDNQMAMINIQDLMGRINEIFGLASNMISSSHDTLKAIIGNLGR